MIWFYSNEIISTWIIIMVNYGTFQETIHHQIIPNCLVHQQYWVSVLLITFDSILNTWLPFSFSLDWTTFYSLHLWALINISPCLIKITGQLSWTMTKSKALHSCVSSLIVYFVNRYTIIWCICRAFLILSDDSTLENGCLALCSAFMGFFKISFVVVTCRADSQ